MNKITLVISASVLVIIIGVVVYLFRTNAPELSQMPTTQMVTTTTTPKASSSDPYQAKGPLHNAYDINTPNALMLVDSQGRRTGQDPTTGKIYQEIPGTSYIPQGTSAVLAFFSPPAGQYMIDILGGEAGTYHLDYKISDGQHPGPTYKLTGQITKGQKITYTQNYDPNNLASSTLILAQ